MLEHLLEAHGADRAAIRLCKAELAEALVASVDAHLQAPRAAEDHAMRAERTTPLAKWEVRFLQTLNVRFHSSSWSCLFPIIHLPGELHSEKATQGTGKQIRQADCVSRTSRCSWASTWLICTLSRRKSKSLSSHPRLLRPTSPAERTIQQKLVLQEAC
jgi:hypothetical protein